MADDDPHHDPEADGAPTPDDFLLQHMARLMEENPETADEVFARDYLKAVEQVSSDMLPDFMAKAREFGRATLEQEKANQAAFEARLSAEWGEALDALQQCISGCLETGSEMNRRPRGSLTQDEEVRYSTLFLLHAKACRVAREIHLLLASGYAAGALARWRTLHELNVFAYVIAENEPAIAIRYQQHEVIQQRNDAISYEKHHRHLGYQPLEEGTLDRLEVAAASLVDEHGSKFERDYGWATPALRGQSAKGFHGLEVLAGFGHMNPFYKWACHDVHGGAKGSFASLFTDHEGSQYFLVGPSNAGLADPGHATALSLAQITLPLITRAPEKDLMDVVLVKALLKFAEDAGQDFLRAHDRIKSETQRRRREGRSAAGD